MLNKAEVILFYVFLTVLLVGGVNWGIEAFAGRDLFALIINAANKAGGSTLQNEHVKLKHKDAASRYIPRVIYALVFVATLGVVALLLKSALTGGAVVPAL
jgi:hypothetical protein